MGYNRRRTRCLTPMTHSAHVFEVSIPGYRIVRRIGDGGMATVYLAVQTGLDRSVALKVLKLRDDPDQESIARFENEARTIARLDHPHIVRIFDVGRSDAGQLYFTMQFLPAGDLSRQRDRRHPARIIEIMRALLSALAYAHDEGVVHRDVKPENILFDAENQPQLADFGIALSRTAQLRVTQVGATVGSSGYMSPEQARGMATDGRSDLYSLGIVLYELLTGDMPFHGPDALSVAIAHVEDPIPQLPAAQSPWQPLLDGSLAKDPDQRFDHARHMLAALEHAAPAILAGQGKPGFWSRVMPRRSRYNHGILVGAVAAVAAIGLLALLALLRYSASAVPRADQAALPPPATTARTEVPMLGSAELDQMLREANARLMLGALVLPAHDNAGDRFATILETYPGQPEVVAGLASLFDKLARDINQSLQRGDAEAALLRYIRAQELANRAGIRQLPSWSPFVEHVTAKVAAALDDASRHAPGRLTELAPLAEVLGLVVPEPRVVAEAETTQQERAIRSAEVSRNTGAVLTVDGTRIVVAPHEVTRAEYARFARATKRPTGNCREPRNLFSRFRSLDWKDPGYPQSGDHPVVCVSWQDARAYAKWLSDVRDATFRLPTRNEWQAIASQAAAPAACQETDDCSKSTRPVSFESSSKQGIAGLAGNVSEWLGCEGACQDVPWVGRSFRDEGNGSTVATGGSSNPDTAYTTVGFRLVRETGGAG